MNSSKQSVVWLLNGLLASYRYVEANLAMKQVTLERLQEISVNMSRYSVRDDALM